MSASDSQVETLLQTIEARRTLGGRFENIRRLGAYGGNGVFSLVLTADDNRTGKRVALKFFNPQHMNDQYRWQCFLREPELLLRFVGEPDVLQCIAPRDEFTLPFRNGAFELQISFSYYAVELATSDVSEAILSDSWTAQRRLEVFRAMCRGVQRAHVKHIAHRDLKPSNFLVMADGSIRLSDFGTARDVSHALNGLLNRYTISPGDLTYTAPEILALFHDIHPRWSIVGDIYSLGSILFEMFSGTPLFFQLFDDQLIADLQSSMNTVDRLSRIRIYDGFIGTLADAHPLPSLSQFGTSTPNCLIRPLDSLYRSMAAIDYRKRLTDFTQVFSQINMCLWILQHERAYQVMRERRLKLKQIREERQRKQELKASIAL